jgi:hypothetical protein
LSGDAHVCQIPVVGRNTRDQANELSAVAPLVVLGGASPQLVGPCTLVTNGTKTIAFSSAELLRTAGEPLAVALTMDGKKTLPVMQWIAARNIGLGIIEFSAPFPKGERVDVVPLELGSICASVDTRGAPAALVTIAAKAGSFSRRTIPVHVDAVDGGGMSDDVITRLASPTDATDVGAIADGSALFAWMPADPVLGRPSEVVAVAVGLTYRQKTFKPRQLAALAELLGLEDLGRALPFGDPNAEGSNELGQVAGELSDDESGPINTEDFGKRK